MKILLDTHAFLCGRLIAAQALVGRLPLVTGDRVFRKYGVDVLW